MTETSPAPIPKPVAPPDSPERRKFLEKLIQADEGSFEGGDAGPAKASAGDHTLANNEPAAKTMRFE
jgi:hypothetical protein